MFKLFVTVVLGLSLLGCAAAELRSDGFHHRDHEYFVPYKDPAKMEFLGKEWKLKNFMPIKNPKLIQRNSEGEYYGNICVDLDNDGDREKMKAPFYDLFFENNTTGGTISIKTGELSPRNQKKDIEIFFNNYVMSYQEIYPIPIGYTLGYRSANRSVFNVLVAETSRKNIGPYEALFATIQRTAFEESDGESSHVLSSVRIVMAKIDGLITRLKPLTPQQKHSHSLHAGTEQVKGKVLLVAVYQETGGNFGKNLEAFESLVRSLSFPPAN